MNKIFLKKTLVLLIVSSVCFSFVHAKYQSVKKSILTDKDRFSILADQSCKFNDEIGKFPTQNNRIAKIAGNDQTKKDRIAYHAENTYPLIHPKVQPFIEQFLEYKKNNGTSKEKAVYKNMSLDQFIMRLLIKRPLMFMTEQDQYLLRSHNQSGFGGFETIGMEEEQNPLVLKDYLSYDEMAVAALIGVSVPTYFINNGARNNQAVVGIDGSYEEEGIYVGLVGARFEKPGYMEWQQMIITPQQNTQEKGYGLKATNQGILALWSNLYGEKFPTFAEAQSDRSGKYLLLKNGFYLNTSVYKKRIGLVVKPFLMDANKRAKLENKRAYVHVVGLGLGVWQIHEKQANYMLSVYADVISDSHLFNVSDIDFSWFPAHVQQTRSAIDVLTWEKIKKRMAIHFSKRNPADTLNGGNKGKLLVACYAWDGNSYPGNEYWAGMLTASGDPAAACCSTIAELQNPLINIFLEKNVKKIFGVLSEKTLENDSIWRRVKNKIKMFFGW